MGGGRIDVESTNETNATEVSLDGINSTNMDPYGVIPLSTHWHSSCMTRTAVEIPCSLVSCHETFLVFFYRAVVDKTKRDRDTDPKVPDINIWSVVQGLFIHLTTSDVCRNATNCRLCRNDG